MSRIKIRVFVVIAIAFFCCGIFVRAQESIGPELVVQRGHTYPVGSVEFSPDGKWIGTSSNDGTVKIWDAGTSRLLRTFRTTATGWNPAIAISLDSRFLFTVDQRAVLIWNIATGTLVNRLSVTDKVTRLCFTTGGDLISAGVHGTVTFWDIFRATEVRHMETREEIRSMACDEHSKLLALGGKAGSVLVLSMESGQIVLRKTIQPNDGFYVDTLAFSPDGHSLAVAPADQTVRIWHIPSGRETARFEFSDTNAESVRFSPDGTLLAAANKVRLKIWSVSSARPLQAVEKGGAIAFNPDSSRLALAPFSSSEGVTISDLQLPRPLEGHRGSVNAVAWSGDGQLLASAGQDGTIKLWNPITRMLSSDIKAGVGEVSYLSFTPDRRFVAAAGKRAIEIREVNSGRLFRTVRECPALEKDCSYSIAVFSPDGKVLAFVEGTEIWLFDMSSQETRLWNRPKTWQINAIAFSADGRSIFVSGNDATIGSWNLDSKEKIAEYRDPSNQGQFGIQSLAISPDGKWLASAGNSIDIWQISSGHLFRTLSLPAGQTWEQLRFPNSVSFSPDRRHLAASYHKVGTKENFVIWDVITGQKTWVSEYAFADTKMVSFDPSGHWLATAGETAVPGLPYSEAEPMNLWRATFTPVSKLLPAASSAPDVVRFLPRSPWLIIHHENGEFAIWDRDSGVLLRTFAGEESTFNAVEISPDGNLLASAGVLYDRAGNIVRRYEDAGTVKTAVKISSDGRYLASADDKQLRISELLTGKELCKLPLGEDFANQNSLAFSPNGAVLAWRSIKNVALFDSTTGKVRQVFAVPHKKEIEDQLAFSDDGKFLVLSSGPDIYVLDVENGDIRRSFSHGREPQGVSALIVIANKIVASGSTDGTIKLWDLEKGTELRTISAHESFVKSLSFDEGGGWLASAGSDGMVKIWNLTDGSYAASLVTFANSDWLVVSAEQFFDGSNAAWSNVLWRLNGDTFNVLPVEAFFNTYYYPGLLRSVFRREKVPSPGTSFAELNLSQPQLQLTLSPIVSQSTADFADNSTFNKVQVNISAREGAQGRSVASGGVHDLRLFRNGILIKHWKGDLETHGGLFETTAIVPLVHGENRLTAYAFNGDGIKSSDAEVTIDVPEKEKPATAYVVAMGINHYANPDFELKFASSDADSFSKELSAKLSKTGKFSQVKVVLLLDGNATKESLNRAVQRLTGNDAEVLPAGSPLAELHPLQSQDSLFIYFAGHGIAEAGHFYMLPYDFGYGGTRDRISDSARTTIRQYSISDEDLDTMLESADAARIVVVIDACNSGQVLGSAEEHHGPVNSKGLAQLAYDKGIYILTASQSYQAAHEDSLLGHGFLTYALVEEGLKTTAAATDGKVELRRWLSFPTTRVPELQLIRLTSEREHRGFEIPSVRSQESLQRPRVFYRREPEPQPFIVAIP